MERQSCLVTGYTEYQAKIVEMCVDNCDENFSKSAKPNVHEKISYVPAFECLKQISEFV